MNDYDFSLADLSGRLRFYEEMNAETMQKIGKYAEKNGENRQRMYEEYYSTFVKKEEPRTRPYDIITMFLRARMLLNRPENKPDAVTEPQETSMYDIVKYPEKITRLMKYIRYLAKEPGKDAENG